MNVIRKEAVREWEYERLYVTFQVRTVLGIAHLSNVPFSLQELLHPNRAE